jgi:hypothetical protein
MFLRNAGICLPVTLYHNAEIPEYESYSFKLQILYENLVVLVSELRMSHSLLGDTVLASEGDCEECIRKKDVTGYKNKVARKNFV